MTSQVSELDPLGSSISIWVDATLEVPKQLTVTLQEISKGDGAGVKSENKTSTKIDSSPVTYSTRSEVAEEMQWDKVQNQALRKAPSEVNPISTPTFSIFPSVSDLLRFKEDIPPGGLV